MAVPPPAFAPQPGTTRSKARWGPILKAQVTSSSVGSAMDKPQICSIRSCSPAVPDRRICRLLLLRRRQISLDLSSSRPSRSGRRSFTPASTSAAATSSRQIRSFPGRANPRTSSASSPDLVNSHSSKFGFCATGLRGQPLVVQTFPQVETVGVILLGFLEDLSLSFKVPIKGVSNPYYFPFFD
ncbi:hypothetical protein OROGR_030009 [Orobanche gracilis]